MQSSKVHTGQPDLVQCGFNLSESLTNTNKAIYFYRLYIYIYI